MKSTDLTDGELQAAVDAEALYPSQVVAANALGLDRSTYRNRLVKAHLSGFAARLPDYESRAISRPRQIGRPKTGVRRIIVTAAQDGTDIHRPFWNNLQAYAAALEAEIVVGGFTYSHALFTDHMAAHGVFHHELVPHLSTSRIHIADSIAICAEMNTLPTAVRPLSGLATYSGSLNGVFPHAKVQMESVARPKAMGAKINVTTGAVTLPNYIAKKAGMKAQFHHVLGALLIEVDRRGRTWMRHLLADENDGSFQDLDVVVRGGKVTAGNRVMSLVYGDIHYEKAEPGVIKALFGYDMACRENLPDSNMLDALRPHWQFFHDVCDFTYRNHHSRNDPHFRFERWIRGEESVEDSMRGVAHFLEATRRPGCRSVVVSSNHHDAYLKWLKEPDIYARDPVNSLFFLRSQTAVYEAIARGETRFSVFEWALRRLSADALQGVEFPHEEDSIVVAGIEHAMHGHLGANGVRGTPAGISNMGPKSNFAHFHAPGILDGGYRAGVCQLDMTFNRGASSWAIANICTYLSGKRAILFLIDGRWRA